jgi:hypothetical protein
MKEQRNPLIYILPVVCIVCLCCCLVFACLGGGVLAQWRGRAAEPVLMGYEFDGQTAQYPGGDIAAGGHIFIHLYPMPADGQITGLEYARDCEVSGLEQREEIFVLVLRPVEGGYQVVFRQELLVDDIDPTCGGIGRFEFEQPLPVLRGDVLAHWQPDGQAGGPIPLNADQSAVEGRSVGKAGFVFSDTQVGNFISADGFSGRRDYFMYGLYLPSESFMGWGFR